MNSQLRIVYLFGGASLVLGMVFIFEAMSAGPEAGHSALLYWSSTTAGICAAIEAALAVVIVSIQPRFKHIAAIPLAFAILFAWSAATHLRQAKAAVRAVPSIPADTANH